MASIDTSNVLTLFGRISGIGADEAYSEMCSRAAEKIEGMLTAETLTPEQAGRCEYAAACEAAYEYALETASGSALCMSESGAVKAGSGSIQSVHSAEMLRKHALAEISDLIEYGELVFITAEG
ncbi:MAG: hypothetical protein IKO27_06635 [Ruminococcus sp.]|nr:hypothetical protein [Ruminococcus sp.]